MAELQEDTNQILTSDQPHFVTAPTTSATDATLDHPRSTKLDSSLRIGSLWMIDSISIRLSYIPWTERESIRAVGHPNRGAGTVEVPVVW